MRTNLVVLLVLTMALFSSPMAFAHELDSGKQPLVEEKVIKVPGLSDTLSGAKLIPDYEKDYNDLLQQFISSDKKYQALKEEFESGNISIERAKKLALLLQSKESNFKATVEELLSSRYTTDKKQIRPEIIDRVTKSEYTISSRDVIIYPDDAVRYTGNYGSTSGVTSGFTSSNNNNLSHANVLEGTGQLQKTATVLHGWEFVPIIEYPYINIPVSEFKFRYLEADYTIGCGGNGAATLEMSAEIYDATANSLIGYYNWSDDWASNVCYSGGAVSVNEGPTAITFSTFGFFDNHTYRAYVKTHSTAMDGIVQGTLAGNEGTKWRYIEVDFWE